MAMMIMEVVMEVVIMYQERSIGRIVLLHLQIGDPGCRHRRKGVPDAVLWRRAWLGQRWRTLPLLLLVGDSPGLGLRVADLPQV